MKSCRIYNYAATGELVAVGYATQRPDGRWEVEWRGQTFGGMETPWHGRVDILDTLPEPSDLVHVEVE